jgi:hypothetical protein
MAPGDPYNVTTEPWPGIPIISRQSGELVCFFSLPDTKYMPDTLTRVGSAARRTYCSEPRFVPAAARKGITWLIRTACANSLSWK